MAVVCLPSLHAAALLLGAESAVGTDTDPLAVRAAASNAALNGLEQRFQLLQCGANLSDPDPMLQVGFVWGRGWWWWWCVCGGGGGDLSLWVGVIGFL